jgi:large subunit ribosomal protein L22
LWDFQVAVNREHRDMSIMKSKAVARYVKISPRKVRLVMDQIRGKKVEEAFNLLTFAHQRGAFMVKKLIDSAVANAEQNSDVDVDNLYIKRIFADEGPTLKRFRPRAMGRATRIRKRSSHLTVILDGE